MTPRALLLLGLLAAIGAGCGPGGKTPEALGVLTFNLRNGMAQDGPDGWAYRRDMVGRLVAREAPAVMGVQEAWQYQLDELLERVPGYAWVGVPRSNVAQIDEHCAVFYRTDRFALVETGTFWLSDTPDEPTTKFSELQCCLRVVTWAALESLESGRVLHAFNTHFDTIAADQIPQRSAALVARRIDELAGTGTALLTGDFNQPVGSDAYRILTGALEFGGVRGGLVDPWAALGLPEEGSFHRFTGVATGTSRIDWVLGSADLGSVGGRVLHDQEDGRYPSDHFPVAAAFEW